jgi:hypothetical protein
MNTELFNLIQAVVSIIQLILIIIGVPIAFFQLRRNIQGVEMQRLNQEVSSYLTFMDRSYTISGMAMADNELMEIYENSLFPDVGQKSWLDLNKKQQKQYFYLARIISFFEESFVLRSHNLISDEEYLGLTVNWMQEIIELRFFQMIWNYMRQFYRPDFTAYVNDLAIVKKDKFLSRALDVKRLGKKSIWKS